MQTQCNTFFASHIHTHMYSELEYGEFQTDKKKQHVQATLFIVCLRFG